MGVAPAITYANQRTLGRTPFEGTMARYMRIPTRMQIVWKTRSPRSRKIF